MSHPGEVAQNPRAAWGGRINWFRYSSPQSFFPLAGAGIPWFAAAAAVLCGAGLYVSFFVAPTDQQQGESYRIIFIHVPAAWMSMVLYVVMAFWAGVGLVFNTRLSGMMANALGGIGHHELHGTAVALPLQAALLHQPADAECPAERRLFRCHLRRSEKENEIAFQRAEHQRRRHTQRGDAGRNHRQSAVTRLHCAPCRGLAVRRS